jgi:hypothetical protein
MQQVAGRAGSLTFASTFARAIDSICAPLSPATDRGYRGAARNFAQAPLYAGAPMLQLETCWMRLTVIDSLRNTRSLRGRARSSRRCTLPIRLPR